MSNHLSTLSTSDLCSATANGLISFTGSLRGYFGAARANTLTDPDGAKYERLEARRVTLEAQIEEVARRGVDGDFVRMLRNGLVDLTPLYRAVTKRMRSTTKAAVNPWFTLE